MKRTKPKPGNTSSRSKNIGTQTEDIDSLIEIAKLEERLKVLQLENDVLRKHAEAYNRPDDVVRHKPDHNSTNSVNPQTTPKSNVEKSGCGCKGSCSTRICGCVKKSYKCNSSCRCDDKTCQNQKSEHNKENKENKENLNGGEVTPKRKNKAVEKIKKSRGLFSPDVREHYEDCVESEFNDIYFSFNEMDTVVKRSQVDSGNLQKVNIEKEKKNEKEQQESIENIMELEKVLLDPMKPRHQLSRTPPRILEKLPEVENIIQPQPHLKTTQEVLVLPPLDIKEEKVDWEEHTAQLIPCKKCKRTFMPDRIQKHEACCKKI